MIIGRLRCPCVFAALAPEVANDAIVATDVDELELTGEDDADAVPDGSSEEVRDASIARVNMTGYLGVKQAKEVVGSVGRDGEIVVRKADKVMGMGRYLRTAEYMTERVYYLYI